MEGLLFEIKSQIGVSVHQQDSVTKNLMKEDEVLSAVQNYNIHIISTKRPTQCPIYLKPEITELIPVLVLNIDRYVYVTGMLGRRSCRRPEEVCKYHFFRIPLENFPYNSFRFNHYSYRYSDWAHGSPKKPFKKPR